MFTVHIHAKHEPTLACLLPATENAYVAMQGFQELGCHIQLFRTTQQLSHRLELGDVVVGYLGEVQFALDELGLSRPPIVDYPTELQPYYGRRMWQERLSAVANQTVPWPVFIKSDDQKGFTGKVIRTTADLIGTAFQGYDRLVHCAEVVEFVSEWRGFVRHGELIDLRRYHGRWDIYPDPVVVRAALAAWDNKPAGCSLDVGVTATGETLVVECNDGFVLGSYGLNHLRYAKLISARWHELLGAPDPFASLLA